MKHPIKVIYLAIAIAPDKLLEHTGLMDTLSDMRDDGHFIDWAVANRGKAHDSAHLVDGNSPEMLDLFDSVRVSPNTHRDAAHEPLVVDGTDKGGDWCGDEGDMDAPFCVFDPNRQEIIAGPFDTRELAHDAKRRIEAGDTSAAKLTFA